MGEAGRAKGHSSLGLSPGEPATRAQETDTNESINGSYTKKSDRSDLGEPGWGRSTWKGFSHLHLSQ